MRSFSWAKIIYIYLMSILEGPMWTGHCLLFARRIWKLVWTLIQIDHCVSLCWSFETSLLISWKYMEICRIMCQGLYICVCTHTHTHTHSNTKWFGLVPYSISTINLKVVGLEWGGRRGWCKSSSVRQRGKTKARQLLGKDNRRSGCCLSPGIQRRKRKDAEEEILIYHQDQEMLQAFMPLLHFLPLSLSGCKMYLDW